MIQSNYLPWRGYFDFIDDVDVFVIYDDVQYTRNDWRNRNKIKTSKGLQWITVPVTYSHAAPTLILDSKIDYRRAWHRKHIGSLTQEYRNAPYFDMYSDELFSLINGSLRTISELNVSLIRWAMDKLSINSTIKYSQNFTLAGDRNERIIKLLKQLGCTEYLLGPAARAYVDEEAYQREGIRLTYKSYSYPDYPQQYGKFEGAVTVVDLLFNCGPDSRNFLKSQEPNIRAA